VEGHTHTLATAARRKNNEGILLTELDTPNYYSQWQKMPGNPLTWQNTQEQVNHKGRAWIADHIKKTSRSVLDIGCGIGLDYDHYRGSDIRYLGVDITPKFVEAAKQRGAPAEVGDVLNLRFKDESFDTIYCKDLLIHLQPGEWRRALKEMARVAKKQIITLEDRWRNETVYALIEKHASFNESKHDFEMLLFFHNTYNESDFLKQACLLGLNVETRLVKCSPPIRSLDGRVRFSQITIYTKE